MFHVSNFEFLLQYAYLYACHCHSVEQISPILHYSDISGTDEGLVDLHIDLTYLSPLWKLYKGMSDDQGPEQTPSLLRALTELFYVAENVALVCKLSLFQLRLFTYD